MRWQLWLRPDHAGELKRSPDPLTEFQGTGKGGKRNGRKERVGRERKGYGGEREGKGRKNGEREERGWKGKGRGEGKAYSFTMKFWIRHCPCDSKFMDAD